MDEKLLGVIVKRTRKVFPNLQRIVLFGSQATGTSREDSDVDILVVTKTELPSVKRAAKLRLALTGLGIPVDIIVVTPEEYIQYCSWKSSVIAWASREGTVLYEIEAA